MAAGDLHLTNANVRDFSDALVLRRHSELKKKENIQKEREKKVDMVTLILMILNDGIFFSL